MASDSWLELSANFAYTKLADNFSHKSDVTSLKTPLYFMIVFHINMKRRSLTIYADIRHLLDSLVSALAVYATAFRPRLSLFQVMAWR